MATYSLKHLHSALWPFKVIQGHRFMSFKSQYATSY